MDFLIVFLICLAFLLLLTLALLFGRPPVYRPTREEILDLISALCDGSLDGEKWSLFIGIPIVHDPELESIRQACYEIEVSADQGKDIKFSGGGFRYNAQGMSQVEEQKSKLNKLINDTPIFRSF
ncbi:hypothetical protein [Neptunomonas concharum]|uniref:Uncharacterized protein n=1 Tax=Neptunomonas concharum TaxID=1031538 RepID=A0A5P1RE15_9GAMM|nr:hypothetical protein [Neptunomonas concharum]QEQ97868.1 hypothetical protein F0U83_14710 [Neptunomonas concharum]